MEVAKAITQEVQDITQEQEVITQEEEVIKQEEEAITQKEEVITQKEEAITQEEEAITQEEKAITQEEDIIKASSIYKVDILTPLYQFQAIKHQFHTKLTQISLQITSLTIMFSTDNLLII